MRASSRDISSAYAEWYGLRRPLSTSTKPQCRLSRAASVSVTRLLRAPGRPTRKTTVGVSYDAWP
ncbi:hypothetical protein LRR80_01952 [Streptomyces sp. RO-S4]|nr:hypothetical protein [Streptomyces sp. RO-S4]